MTPPADSNDKVELCGLGSWRPKWLQKFANAATYTFVYGTLSVTHGMINAYFNSVTSTLEKRFALQSRTLGILNSTNDIASILFGLVIAYLGSRGSRPLWMSAGVFVTSLGCLVISAAELVPMDGDGGSFASGILGSKKMHYEMCHRSNNVTSTEICNDNGASFLSNSNGALALLFIGQILYGTAKGGFSSLGVAYLDDNIPKKKLPIYLGITWTLRIAGPTVGYVLGAACLKIYRNPKESPGYTNQDPRWIGAWWIGFLSVGIAELVLGGFLLLFPKKLKQEDEMDNNNAKTVSLEKEKEAEATAETKLNKATFKDFFKSIERVIRNRILILQCISHSFHLFAVVGLFTFLPKYLEYHFKISASEASMITGLAGLSVMLFGLFLSGIVIYKLRPRAFFVTGWAVLMHIVSLTVLCIQITLSCPSIEFAGSQFTNGKPEPTAQCSQECHCMDMKPSPVCANGKNYLSPCFAGCQNLDMINGTKTFTNCDCVDDVNSYATSGYCSTYCYTFLIYVVLLSFSKFCTSTTVVGGTLISMRVVLKEDKGLAMAFLGTIADLIAFIPGPIVYGSAIDSTCIMWGEKCGQRTNCWLYDEESLRHILHGLPIGFVAAKLFFDVAICYLSRNVPLFDELEHQKVTKNEDGKSKETVFTIA